MEPDRDRLANRLPRPGAASSAPPRPTCAIGDTLCEVRVLSEAEWDALPADRRPSPAEYFPGLGWVVASPGHASRDPEGPLRRAL